MSRDTWRHGKAERRGEIQRERGRDIRGESDAETEKRRRREESGREELLGDGQTGRKMDRDMERNRDRDGVERRTMEEEGPGSRWGQARAPSSQVPGGCECYLLRVCFLALD